MYQCMHAYVLPDPVADPPKSSGALPFHVRRFRADLQERARGPCFTDGALRWRAKRPHVPTALPDRSTDDPAPPRATVPRAAVSGVTPRQTPPCTREP